MKCVVLGATGLIGQQFIRMLEGHPSFELEGIFASSRSKGKLLKDMWRLPDFECPQEFEDFEVMDVSELPMMDFEICFSGLPSSISREIEHRLRAEGKKVFSNSSAFRMDEDVPILIPEINGEHISTVEIQQRKYDTEGFIVTNSNCSISGVALVIHYLSQIGNIRQVIVDTYQAISGAGFKGLQNTNFEQNVVPFIQKEEEKMVAEGKKILGTLDRNLNFVPAPIEIYPNCARVSSVNGHLAAMTIFHDEWTQDPASYLKTVESNFQGSPYYVAPKHPIVVMEEMDRPQPKLDSYAGQPTSAAGMAAPVGRLRDDGKVLRLFVLAHNTIRGGSGGSILNAEYALANGYL